MQAFLLVGVVKNNKKVHFLSFASLFFKPSDGNVHVLESNEKLAFEL